MRIALVLGSGGARGYAHIGVIEELKRRGHEIVAIAGTSMGSIIGGLEAAGKLDQFADWATGLTQFDVLRMYDPAFTQPGIIKAEKIFSMVDSFTPGVQIEDLDIPFTAVATDITNHREVWFQRGDLVTAMRASCAIPTFISPIMVNGKILADGGLVNPVPIEPTLAVPSDMTISIALSGRPNSNYSASAVVESASQQAGNTETQERTLSDRLRRGVAGLMDTAVFKHQRERGEGNTGILSEELFGEGEENSGEESRTHPEEGPGQPTGSWSEIGKLPADLNTMGVINMALDTMQDMIERYRAAANPVNVKISVPSAVCGTLDFHKAAEVIETGRQLAIDAFDEAGI